jgi:hypothetical protein
MKPKIVLAATLSFCIASPSPATAQIADAIDDFDPQELHESWSKKVLDTANRIDSWFGDDRIDEEAQQTRLRAYGDLEFNDEDGTDLRVRVKAHLVLPNTRERFRLELNGTDDENAWSDEDRDTEQARENRERTLGLNYNASRGARTSTDLGVGARYRDSEASLYLKGRHRAYFPAEQWLPRLTNEARVYTDTGWQYQGTLDFDRELSDIWFFRSRSELRWFEDRDVEEENLNCNNGYCINQFFSLYQDFPDRDTAIAYDWNNYFVTEPENRLEEVQLGIRYRRQTKWDWLHYEIRPSVRFLEETDFEDQYSIVFRLEGIFGYRAETELRFRDTDVDSGNDDD